MLSLWFQAVAADVDGASLKENSPAALKEKLQEKALRGEKAVIPGCDLALIVSYCCGLFSCA